MKGKDVDTKRIVVGVPHIFVAMGTKKPSLSSMAISHSLTTSRPLSLVLEDFCGLTGAATHNQRSSHNKQKEVMLSSSPSRNFDVHRQKHTHTHTRRTRTHTTPRIVFYNSTLSNHVEERPCEPNRLAKSKSIRFSRVSLFGLGPESCGFQSLSYSIYSGIRVGVVVVLLEQATVLLAKHVLCVLHNQGP